MELITVYEVPVQSQAQPGAAYCNRGDPRAKPGGVGWRVQCRQKALSVGEHPPRDVWDGRMWPGLRCTQTWAKALISLPHTRDLCSDGWQRTMHHRCHNLELAWRAVTWSEKGDDSPELGRAKAGPESGPSPSLHSCSRGQLHHPPCLSSALAGETWSPQRCRAQACCRQVPARCPTMCQ